MFSALLARLAPRDHSAEFAARRAERERIEGMIQTHLAGVSHSPDGLPSRCETRSEYDAHASQVDAIIARETAKARDISRRGHRLYKATSRALVDASARSGE